MENATGTNYRLELLEYGFVAEDTPCTARTVKVKCPKLQAMKSGSANTSTQSVNPSNFINADVVEFDFSETIEDPDCIVAKMSLQLAHRHKFHDCEGCPCPNKDHPGDSCHPVTGHLNPCDHYHHDHHFPHDKKGMIPEGTKVILLFMNHDQKDCYVTRLWCEFPGGKSSWDDPMEVIGDSK